MRRSVTVLIAGLLVVLIPAVSAVVMSSVFSADPAPQSADPTPTFSAAPRPSPTSSTRVSAARTSAAATTTASKTARPKPAKKTTAAKSTTAGTTSPKPSVSAVTKPAPSTAKPAPVAATEPPPVPAAEPTSEQPPAPDPAPAPEQPPAQAPGRVAPAADSRFGLLQAEPSQVAELRAANVSTVTIELTWELLEPKRGQVNRQYISEQQAKAREWRRLGMKIVLDTGIQYPPGWVFDLPGGTRLVNQWGETFTGDRLGTRFANGVFNGEVREAERAYFGLIRANFGDVPFEAVRIGGLYLGELSFPPTDRSGTLWMYDESAQAASPVPGWKPGTGNTADAQKAADYYIGMMNDYAKWLIDLTAQTFPDSDLQLLLPSWGLRPDHLQEAVASGLTGKSTAEVNGLVTQALDWTTQLDHLAAYGSRGVAYTTWIDAPHNGDSIRDISPVEYLRVLADERGLGVAGENTGFGSLEVLEQSIEKGKNLNLRSVMWMNATDLLADPAKRQVYAAANSAP